MKRSLFVTLGVAGVWLALAFPALAASPRVTPAERELIEKAIPKEPAVNPEKPRRLLIFTLNVGYGGHPSIAYANEAFTLMGQRTGAYETEVSYDPAVFSKDSLQRFDAVFFNNTVGNCFTNDQLRANLQEFVTGGGGLLGVHGTTVAFTQWPGAVEDWPEFGYMIGARGANHKASDELVHIKLDDATHPLLRAFNSKPFDYRDEFFRVNDPYSRDRLRILLSIDTNRTDVTSGAAMRQDHDYALAWIRNYGRGRVFYSTIAHNPYVFWDPVMLQFYLDAVQFALGDLHAPTTPSSKLTPAVRAEEALGWKLGIEAYTFHKFTFFETIEKTASLRLPFIGGLSFQKVGGGIDKDLAPGLSDNELRQIRLKMEQAGVRLLTYYIHDLPGDEAACRKIFEFGRKMGIETFMSEPKLEALDTVEKLCEEYGIRVALHNHDQKASPHYWSPEAILKVCENRSAKLGAAADIGYWIRAGIDPIEGVRKLGKRLLTLQLHDLDAMTNEGQDVPWGTGASKTAELLRALKASGATPTMIGLEYSRDFENSMSQVAQCRDFYYQTVLKLQ